MASASSDMLPRFVYEPLEPGQIRVLQMSAGERGDALSGELLIANIDDESFEYDALSYMWGDPAPTDNIYISGKALPIASNLNTALHYLRYTDKPTVIWIDAICINQTDKTERSEQVQLMRRLYSGASTVRIWINEPDIDGTSEAITALKKFHEAFDPYISDLKEAYLLKMGEDPSFWAPVIPIFTNEYWARAWIQQEVLNATQISLYCMDIIIPGDAIKWFHLAVKQRYLSSAHSATPWDTAWENELRDMMLVSPAVAWMLDCRGGKLNQYLFELLGQELGVSLPQDRVYSLMYLAKDYMEDGIAIDYTKSGIDVMVEAAAYHVQVHHNLRFLKGTNMQASSNVHEYQKHGLHAPTWLPRSWLGEKTHINLGDWPETTKTRCLAKSILKPERLLQIRAIRLDRVQYCMNRGLTDKSLIIHQFQESLLVSHLCDFVAAATTHLPPRALKTLFGASEWHLQKFAQLRNGYLKARNEHTSRNGQLDWDETDKDHLYSNLRKAGLSAILLLQQLIQDPRYAEQYLTRETVLNTDLLEGIDPATMAALQCLLRRFYRVLFIKTEMNRISQVVDCAIADGDEIWIALGCDVPIVLRPQSNGRYWFVCAADLPDMRVEENLQQFTSDVQPGDRFGERIVEDIEIE